MEDFYQDGFNRGYGQGWKNRGHEYPQSDGDRYSYEHGYQDGEQRRRAADELEEEGY